jgi:hypothetical protein
LNSKASQTAQAKANLATQGAKAAQAAFDSAEALATQLMNTAMKATVKTVVKTVVRNIKPKSNSLRVAAEAAPIQTSISETTVQAEMTTTSLVETVSPVEADEESMLSPEIMKQTQQEDEFKNIPIPQPKGPRQPIVAKRPANWDELIEFKVWVA